MSSVAVKYQPVRDGHAYTHMNFLYQASVLMAGQNGMLSSYYGKLCRRIGQKTTKRIEPAIKRYLCKGCSLALQPGITADVRCFDAGAAARHIAYRGHSQDQPKAAPTKLDRAAKRKLWMRDAMRARRAILGQKRLQRRENKTVCEAIVRLRKKFSGRHLQLKRLRLNSRRLTFGRHCQLLISAYLKRKAIRIALLAATTKRSYNESFSVRQANASGKKHRVKLSKAQQRSKSLAGQKLQAARKKHVSNKPKRVSRRAKRKLSREKQRHGEGDLRAMQPMQLAALRSIDEHSSVYVTCKLCGTEKHFKVNSNHTFWLDNVESIHHINDFGCHEL